MKYMLLSLLLLTQALSVGMLRGQNSSSAYALATANADTLTTQQIKMMNAFHLVSSTQISDWSVEFLKDEYRGRRSGDMGYDLAAEYITERFVEWGLKPKGDDGTYYNTFAQPYNEVYGVGHLQAFLRVGKAEVVKHYVAGKEYFPVALSAPGEVRGEVVYAGYGIHAPELGYNDFKGVDMRGKVALIEGGYPYKGKNPDSLQMWSRYQGVYPKIAAAAAAGAVGVLYVSKYANPFPPQTPGVVVAFVSQQTAQDLVLGTGKTLEQLRQQFDAFKGRALSTGRSVSVASESTFYPDRKTSNIVGMIQGSDPVLKNEYIILGAHIDHLGMLPQMYPGALDNVSGSVIVMAAGKAIAQSGVELKRTIIVVLFASEELGVLGAGHFLNTLPFPKEKIVCMVNVDMLGTGTGFKMHSCDEWAELMPYFREASEEWTRRPFQSASTPWKYLTRFHTDGNAFQNQQIPTFELKGTGGVWPAPYHVPEDVISQLDPVIMADAARVLVIGSILIANR